jgi:hypothetical protein
MAKPPTMGDRLRDRMAERGQSAGGAAAALGATPVEVEHWAADVGVPRDGQLSGIADYLGVDAAEVRRLVLRSQMRRVQREIRGEAEPTRAAS